MTAYEEGLRAGRLDLLLGCMSTYALAGTMEPPSSYSHQYARGYRLGLAGL